MILLNTVTPQGQSAHKSHTPNTSTHNQRILSSSPTSLPHDKWYRAPCTRWRRRSSLRLERRGHRLGRRRSRRGRSLWRRRLRLRRRRTSRRRSRWRKRLGGRREARLWCWCPLRHHGHPSLLHLWQYYRLLLLSKQLWVQKSQHLRTFLFVFAVDEPHAGDESCKVLPGCQTQALTGLRWCAGALTSRLSSIWDLGGRGDGDEGRRRDRRAHALFGRHVAERARVCYDVVERARAATTT